MKFLKDIKATITNIAEKTDFMYKTIAIENGDLPKLRDTYTTKDMINDVADDVFDIKNTVEDNTETIDSVTDMIMDNQIAIETIDTDLVMANRKISCIKTSVARTDMNVVILTNILKDMKKLLEQNNALLEELLKK